MPNFDGTGPRGEGPLTGCGRGYCIIPLNLEQEIEFLRKRSQLIHEEIKELKDIEARIEELERSKEVCYARI